MKAEVVVQALLDLGLKLQEMEFMGPLILGLRGVTDDHPALLKLHLMVSDLDQKLTQLSEALKGGK